MGPPRALMQCWLILGCLIVLIGNGGCRGVQQTFEPPRVSLIGFRVESVDLLEQQYRLAFRVLNPNPIPLSATGVFADVRLAERRFASGVTNSAFTVSGYGRATFEMLVSATLLDAVSGLAQMDPTAGEPLEYRIDGWVHVDAPKSVRLPFDIKGRIPIETRDQ